MKLVPFNEHFFELKAKLRTILIVYLIAFTICYYYSTEIYRILLHPLINSTSPGSRKIIYTGLTEAFFSYIKLAAFSSFIIILPLIALQLYLFVSKGLYKSEKIILAFVCAFIPLLFWSGSFFVFQYVMPKAWVFFLGFEDKDAALPIIFESRVSEYLNLVIELITGFGIAFQLPVVIIVLNILKIISSTFLINNRRYAIVINFLLSGFLTPPDVLSQFALAIPMLILYEVSIMVCKYIENRS